MIETARTLPVTKMGVLLLQFLAARLLLLCNDIELNPGPGSGGNGGGGGGNVRGGSAGKSKKTGDTMRRKFKAATAGMVFPKSLERMQYLMREERQTQLEGRQEQVEIRLRQVLDYCRKISADSGNRQNIVDELRTRVAELENEQTMMTARIESVGNAATAVGAETAPRAPPASLSASSTTTEGLSPSSDATRDSGMAATRLENAERQMAKMRLDLGELMVVYDDMQDRLYEMDRSWRNNLVFNGIKTDGHGCYESPECTEGKVRQILKNHLNIGREIIINRCHRVYNGADKFGNKPVVVNFHKFFDKEEILRKSKVLRNSGVVVEEDLSRAAKNRRRELEKFVKEIKAIDGNKKCVLNYDKLIVDEHVFIFNDQEKRIERLPYTVSGALAPPPIAARVFDDLHNLSSGINTPSLTVGRMNFKSRSAGASRSGGRLVLPPSAAATAVAAFSSDGAKMNRGGSGAGRSIESLLEAVPPVTNGSLLGGGGGGGYGDELSTGGSSLSRSAVGSANSTGSLLNTSAISTPCLSDRARRERAEASAREKMVPNLRLSSITGSGEAGMNPADVGLEDGGESMWEDAGEENDCDFADDDDNVDGGDPEVKELMSEIMGKEEADEVLDHVEDPPETEKTRVHLPELAPQLLPHVETTKNKMVEHEGRKHKKRHSTRRIGSGRARNRMSKITASATTTATSNGMSGGGNKKKRDPPRKRHPPPSVTATASSAAMESISNGMDFAGDSTESDLSDVGEIAAAAAADSDSYCSSDVLPLNHVWDWEEWDEYGIWRPPPGHEEKLLKKQAARKARRKERRVTTAKADEEEGSNEKHVCNGSDELREKPLTTDDDDHDVEVGGASERGSKLRHESKRRGKERKTRKELGGK